MLLMLENQVQQLAAEKAECAITVASARTDLDAKRRRAAIVQWELEEIHRQLAGLELDISHGDTNAAALSEKISAAQQASSSGNGQSIEDFREFMNDRLHPHNQS